MAAEWYELHERHFWQDEWWGAGWREFVRDRPDSEWTYDVDSGPIIGGFSPSANGFGLAAARRNGQLDHGYTLGAQLLTVCWPLPDGRLLVPRLLSDREHAPYLGETAILWQLTETPAEGTELVQGGHLAGSVYIGLAVYFGVSVIVLVIALLRLRWLHRRLPMGRLRGGNAQCALWAVLLIGSVVLFVGQAFAVAAIALLVAQVLPILWTKHAPADAIAGP